MQRINVRFGSVIRKHREELKISQEELADRTGLHRTYIGLIERGKRSASLGTLQKLAQALGVGMAELLDEVEQSTGQETKQRGDVQSLDNKQDHRS